MTDKLAEPKCACCGVPFERHLGLVGMCRKWLKLRCELQELVTQCEVALTGLRNEFGNLVVDVNFGYLQTQIDAAKRAAESCDTTNGRT